MNKLQKYILNNQPVWRGKLIKYKGVRPTQPISFTIRQLTRKDADAMSILSSEIYQNLKQNEECFIHRHDATYYKNVFDNPDMQYIGIFIGSKLIGMSYLRVCRTQNSVAEELPNSPVNFFTKQTAKIAALGADCVLPDFRGNNLNKIMISCRIELAYQMQCTDAVSIVDRNNHWNMPPYFNNGFYMYATSIDPIDNGEIALMHHAITQTRNTRRPFGIKVPYQCFDKIDIMLKKGFIGSEYDRESACVLFVPADRVVHYAEHAAIQQFIADNKKEYARA